MVKKQYGKLLQLSHVPILYQAPQYSTLFVLRTSEMFIYKVRMMKRTVQYL